MDEFISTRQVIEILKVDRITIYRMLQDGRLKGIKIGQQWRFPRGEVDRLLGAEPIPTQNAQANPSTSFPTHCIQTVQDLFSEVSQMSGLVLAENGDVLTEITHACSFCQLMLRSPEGHKACSASWRSFAQRPNSGIQQHTCHAGWRYVSAPILDEEKPIGIFLSGPFTTHPPESKEDVKRFRELAAQYGHHFAHLQKAAREVPVIPLDQVARVEAWSSAVARAVQSILHERTNFLSRLQQIADLSQIA
ncbi:MAG: PocR ligand-binding domain-containing protein [Anaerolineaceae bacterium]|nr:PocR ligand-binding domain-containing protein [Anaerolineaceae bacterium]